MHQVKGEYPDFQRHPITGSFSLNADQAFNPFTWQAPIQWEGYVGGRKVMFIQIENGIYGLESFDWLDFPQELEYVKTYIADAIDKAMKIMD